MAISLLSPLNREARKWRALFSIYFQDGLAYRASGFIWVFTDLVTAVTMPLVWASASRAGLIQGYSAGDFVLYYLCMLLVGAFVTSHMMWDLATQIREGLFMTMLARPVSYYTMSYMSNLAWRVVRTGLSIPLFIGLIFLYRGYLGDATVHLNGQFFLSLVLGHFVSFTFVMLLAPVALYVTEATSIYELYYIPLMFLSGQLFPIAVLPEWARNLSLMFPFYYTLGAPTEILIGRLHGDAAIRIIGIQLVWIVVTYSLSKLVWKRGLRQYTGFGM